MQSWCISAGVTDATVCYSGQDLFDGLDQSFGYLTVEPGWCNDGTCRVRAPLNVLTILQSSLLGSSCILERRNAQSYTCSSGL